MKTQFLNEASTVELAHIMQEVKQHGFYVTQLDAFLPDIKSTEERMYVICVIAKQAHLKASFNLDRNLCVLEMINSI
ncbi:MAG TPA: hypothetical protein PLJ94_06900 [Methylotenera sp.]|nr:hypothetical protein [Methylotenera sp.]HPH08391.1 hypothetical protein [Methylotenera sp.]HPM48666.1 hypothetical protein [Methylotenera sp.]